MTAAELIEKLSSFPAETPVALCVRVGDDDEMYELMTDVRLVESHLLAPARSRAPFLEVTTG